MSLTNEVKTEVKTLTNEVKTLTNEVKSLRIELQQLNKSTRGEFMPEHEDLNSNYVSTRC